MIETVSSLIDELGGTKTVATMLGVKDNTVSTWRRGDRGFPAWACSKLRDAAKSAGLNVDDGLFEIRVHARARSAA